MKIRILIFLSIAARVAVVTAQSQSVDIDEDDNLLVPKSVMNFIMKCQRNRSPVNEGLVPVYRTDITDSGTTSQQVSLLGIDELQASLKTAIESDDVTSRIMERIKEFHGSNKPNFRQGVDGVDCPPTTNVINIDVPPEELEVFHLRMERVMQQNNNILLGLINNMISTKFTTIEDNLSSLITNNTDKIIKIIERIESGGSRLQDLVKDESNAGEGTDTQTIGINSDAENDKFSVIKHKSESEAHDENTNVDAADAVSKVVNAIKSTNAEEIAEKDKDLPLQDSEGDEQQVTIQEAAEKVSGTTDENLTFLSAMLMGKLDKD